MHLLLAFSIRIRKAIADYPTMKFEFRNMGHGFLTQFSYTKQKVSSTDSRINEKVGEKLSDNQLKILNLLAEDKFKTGKILALDIGISLRKIEANLWYLKHNGFLQRIGSAKGGYWKVSGE